MIKKLIICIITIKKGVVFVMNKLRFFTKVAMQCQSQEHLNDANLFSLFRFYFLEKSTKEVIPLTIL